MLTGSWVKSYAQEHGKLMSGYTVKEMSPTLAAFNCLGTYPQRWAGPQVSSWPLLLIGPVLLSMRKLMDPV